MKWEIDWIVKLILVIFFAYLPDDLNIFLSEVNELLYIIFQLSYVLPSKI